MTKKHYMERSSKRKQETAIIPTDKDAYIRMLEQENARLRTVNGQLVDAAHNPLVGQVIPSDDVPSGAVYLRVPYEDYTDLIDKLKIQSEFVRVTMEIVGQCQKIDGLAFSYGAYGRNEIEGYILEAHQRLIDLKNRLNHPRFHYHYERAVGTFNRLIDTRLQGVALMKHDRGKELRRLAAESDPQMEAIYYTVQDMQQKPPTTQQWIGQFIGQGLIGQDYARATHQLWEYLQNKGDLRDIEQEALQELEKLDYEGRIQYCRKAYHNFKNSRLKPILDAGNKLE